MSEQQLATREDLLIAAENLGIAAARLEFAYKEAERDFRPRDPLSAYYGGFLFNGEWYFPFRRTERAEINRAA